jgi:hypothetical protein
VKGRVDQDSSFEATQVIFIDREWHRNSNSGFDFGILVWKENETEPRFLQLMPDDYISWTLLGPKHCVGSRSNTGGLKRCPEIAIVGKDKQRCGPCSAVDAYDPCIRCSGQSCNADKERAEKCAQTEYVVYLALFSGKILKVGVSVKRRFLTRWVEQGADFGIILTNVKGGQDARNIEYTLSKNLNLGKRVQTTRKSNGILHELSYNDAQECLEEFKKSFDKSNFEFDLKLGKLTNLTKFYNLSDLHTKPMQWLESKSSIDGTQLFGHIVGMKGSILVTRIKNWYTYANVRKMIGYTIDSEKEINAVTQSGLLDYF